MPLLSLKPVPHQLVAGLAVLFTLAACGGGGGATEAVSDAAKPAVTTVTTLLPGSAMNWVTASDKTISLTVQAADGRPAAGAAVRVFTVSRTSPHDGAGLIEPVPMSLLDTVVSDASGRASLTLQWPGHIDELLAVATLEDSQGQAVLTANVAAGVVLQLAR